jgi:hypothetical protein
MTDLAPKRRPIRDFMARAARNWRARHRHPFNFWIHMLGVPLAVAGLLLMLASALFLSVRLYWGVGTLIAGYVLQYLGHRVEGNDVGEWAAIKRLFGLPCTLIAPRWLPGRQEKGEPPSHPG